MMMTKSEVHRTNPFYEAPPEYDLWLKLTIGSIVALTAIPGAFLLYYGMIGGWVLLGVTLLNAVFVASVLPRRYQIFSDRLRIVLGHPFALNIPFSTVREARSTHTIRSFTYWGLRLTTSSKNVIELIRNGGWNIVITPVNRDVFLKQLTLALKEYRIQKDKEIPEQS